MAHFCLETPWLSNDMKMLRAYLEHLWGCQRFLGIKPVEWCDPSTLRNPILFRGILMYERTLFIFAVLKKENWTCFEKMKPEMRRKVKGLKAQRKKILRKASNQWNQVGLNSDREWKNFVLLFLWGSERKKKEFKEQVRDEERERERERERESQREWEWVTILSPH